MKIKHTDLEVPENNPFAHCRLQRRAFAEALTKIVTVYTEGFVLTINNEWGTGKTTFVKMWQQSLINEGFQTVYFNAWENDFDTNPLVAILSELKTLIRSDNKVTFNSVIEKGAIIATSILPTIAKGLVKPILNADEVLDVVAASVAGATAVFKEELENYKKKKETIKSFKAELEKFIFKKDNARPVIFIIDELDRCRPDYAVQVLEQMKHFFSVKGITFVLAIDKQHLASSVKGFYGSEHINTDEYLRRFIDFEYNIPPPSTEIFVKYLYDYYDYNSTLLGEERRKIEEFKQDGEILLAIAKVVLTKTGATLRQQDKLFANMRMVLLTFKANTYALPNVLFILIFLKMFREKQYGDIQSCALNLQGLVEVVENLLPSDANTFYNVNFLYIVARFLKLYVNTFEPLEGRHWLQALQDKDALKTVVTSRFDRSEDGTELFQAVKDIGGRSGGGDLNFKFLFDRINLILPVII